jgi:hypothetical protein
MYISMAIDLSETSNTVVAFVPIMLLVSIVGWVIHTVRKSL